MHSVTSYSAALTPPSVACSITKQCWCRGLWQGRISATSHNIATQNTWTRRSRLQRSAARFLFELFYEFYWLLLATTFECFKATLAMLQRQMLIALPPPPPALPVLIVTLFRLLPRRVVSHFLRLPTVSQSLLLLLLPAGLTGVVLATHG